jgi:hypothetical protein
VPARQADGGCHWHFGGRCAVHDNAPFGCAFCPRCRCGHCPWDAALWLASGDLTPAAEELVSLAGLLSSFAEAAEKVLPRLAGLGLAESMAERATEAAGALVR